jgi:hypothetical protein
LGTIIKIIKGLYIRYNIINIEIDEIEELISKLKFILNTRIILTKNFWIKNSLINRIIDIIKDII